MAAPARNGAAVPSTAAAPQADALPLLAGKRLLITGVLTKGSIAYAVAERAQRLGAEIALTGFGRTRRMTERAAQRLPQPPDVLELDVNSADDLAALRDELSSRWGTVDGALHAIAFAPGDALGGNFMAAPSESAEIAFRTSAYSFKALAEALQPLMAERGGSLVGLDFDASVAWPIYDWMGVAKAALESVSRYLARDLGPAGVRVNLVSAGPIETPAAGGIPGFEQLAAIWGDQAPLGWETADAAPVADAICFLLSDLARAISGEIVHVDGGFHAMGAPLAQAGS
jgi:meromycolic acid enoyl-[acyl-carrier protein] reductase